MQIKISTWFIKIILPLLFIASSVSASDDLSIGRMRVSIWPEYDDPGVLVIYDGRFKDDTSFPAEAVFYIPKGASISDACSLSPKGQHFCQLKKKKNAGDVDEVRLKLPFPNFYLSFHVNPFKEEAKGKGQRAKGRKAFDYIVKTTHAIDKLEVDIQKPLRAEDFKITPQSTEKRGFKGFEHYDYVYENVQEGQEIKFNVSYAKNDSQPSQDIKYSRMTEPKVFGSPFEERKRFSRTMLLAGIAGLLVLAGMLMLVFRKRKV
ncbi:MAG: LPXTG cell wall anchor domain-containing protein [Deltaproteobacteria bacterium]|nr:LPXTG cell wall anchor domain-containing protein [Deltaproteobacteria bacterium]